MDDNFNVSLTYVLQSEGGFVNDPQDPGGATNEGVTQHQYDLWRLSHNQQTQSVRFIDPNEVEAIYRKWYWAPVSADILPAGVDYCAFDAAVNSGPHRATQWLQQAVGAVPDGQIGSKTMAGVHSTEPNVIIHRMCEERLTFLKGLGTWQHFGKGWEARVDIVEMAAKRMAQ